ncbi:hypothetical protein OSTOST_23010, partial [Ostertagia ostertagi]
EECERVRGTLNHFGILAEAYHAGLPDTVGQVKWGGFHVGDAPCVAFILADTVRGEIQHRWLRNDINVICATIAFGMGVDKPDVRDWIRAWTRWRPSYCLLLYAYKDAIRLRQLVEGRKLLVEHFGEVYDAQMCLKSAAPCDVCQRLKHNPEGVKLCDMSEEALMMLKAISEMGNVSSQ